MGVFSGQSFPTRFLWCVMFEPLVTIGIPTFNRVGLLQQSLASAQAQTAALSRHSSGTISAMLPSGSVSNCALNR